MKAKRLVALESFIADAFSFGWGESQLVIDLVIDDVNSVREAEKEVAVVL